MTLMEIIASNMNLLLLTDGLPDEKIHVLNVWNLARGEYFRASPHRPEHYDDPSEMDELHRKYLLCDMLAERWMYDVAEAAYLCRRDEAWKWVEHLYKGEYDEPKDYFVRRPNNDDDEKLLLARWAVCFWKNKVSPVEYVQGLYTFDCADRYRKELMIRFERLHTLTRQLFPEDVDLHEAIENHDQVKWVDLLFTGFVLKDVFDVDAVGVGETFDFQRLDDWIKETIEKGKREQKPLVLGNPQTGLRLRVDDSEYWK